MPFLLLGFVSKLGEGVAYIYIYKDSFWLVFFRAARPDLSEKMKPETYVKQPKPSSQWVFKTGVFLAKPR